MTRDIAHDGRCRIQCVQQVAFFVVVAAIALALAPAPARGSCGSAQCPLDTHGTETLRWDPSLPGGQPVGRITVGVSYQYIDQDRPRIGTRPAAIGELGSREDEIRTINRRMDLTLRGALAEGWSVSASLPLVDRYHSHIVNEADGSSQRQEFRYNGVGDLTVLGYWTPWGSDHERTTLTLQGGIKVPTGLRHVEPIDGEEPEPPARPGSGSADGLFGLHLMHVLPSKTLGGGATVVPIFASALLRLNGRGTEGYRVGHEVQLSVGGGYPLINRLRFAGQLNARIAARDEVGTTDATRENTGGRWLYASPGLQFAATDNVGFTGFLQVPVYQRVNRIQLAAPLNLWFGVTYRLPTEWTG